MVKDGTGTDDGAVPLVVSTERKETIESTGMVKDGIGLFGAYTFCFG